VARSLLGRCNWLAIGGGFVSDNINEQDRHDAASLYDVLFNKVIKTYYNDHKKWNEMMSASINAMVDRYLRIEWLKNIMKNL
jgi:starch phosphorylase